MSSKKEPQPREQSGRGVVIFQFGYTYALRLLVCLYTLRKYYSGSVTVFLRDDQAGRELRPAVERLGVQVEILQRMSRSFDRHRIFLESPYATTLSVDADTIFQGPIDELWEPLEREGLLLTQFHAPPYGIDGTPERQSFATRIGLLNNVRSLLAAQDYDAACDQMLMHRIDINIGMMGIARPKGDAFLFDWAEHLERGSDLRVLIMDEMLAVALFHKYSHYLADEKWNCPAQEYFRATNLADAKVIHYFSDGHYFRGQRLGRNASEWAGHKWDAAYEEASQHLDLLYWRKYDPYYFGPLKRFALFCLKLPKDFMYTLNRISRVLNKLVGR